MFTAVAAPTAASPWQDLISNEPGTAQMHTARMPTLRQPKM